MRRAAFLFVLAVGFLVGGCAKYPDTGATTTGAQLNITLTVAGQINPSDYYFVVFNNANQQSPPDGPDPVIAPPWGNGFVAGQATSYLEFNSSQPGDGYFLYSFVPGSLLQQSSQIGLPISDSPVSAGSRTLQFRIPLSNLATSTLTAGQTNYIQVNFIATNTLPANPDDPNPNPPKEFDALGDQNAKQTNAYITIPTNVSGTYTNTDASGDVQVANGSGGYSALPNQTDPSVQALDITGYTIQVTH